MAIKLIDRGSQANARVLRAELVNNRRLDGHPHIIGLKVGGALAAAPAADLTAALARWLALRK